MSSLQLNGSQKRILRSLVNLTEGTDGPVRGREIAEELDRNPGTIRNQMQSLKALRLVEGIPGPKGGYKPTAEAYETLDIQRMDDPARVPVEHEGEPVRGINVDEIDLATVHDPDRCRAEVSLRGSIRDIHRNDRVTIGPTPASHLTLSGVVDSADPAESTLVLQIQEMNIPGPDAAE